jgi:hypothetical protein
MSVELLAQHVHNQSNWSCQHMTFTCESSVDRGAECFTNSCGSHNYEFSMKAPPCKLP